MSLEERDTITQHMRGWTDYGATPEAARAVFDKYGVPYKDPLPPQSLNGGIEIDTRNPDEVDFLSQQLTNAAPVTPQRRATKTISSMELGPSPAEALPVRPEGTEDLTPTTEAPDWQGKLTGGPELPDPGDNFQDWMKNLLKGEEGTFDPAAGLSNALAAWRRRVGHPEPEAGAETPRQRVERYYAGFSRVSREDRAFVENLPDDALQDFIARQSQNPNYVETPTGQNLLAHAQNTLDMRAAGELGSVRPTPELIEPETGRPAEPYDPYVDQFSRPNVGSRTAAP